MQHCVDHPGSTPAFSTGWAEILVVKHPVLLREREMQLIYRTIGWVITSHSPCKSHQESGWNLRTKYIAQPIETLRLNWTSSTVMFNATYDRNPVELRFYKVPSRSAQKRERACKMYLRLFPDEPAYFVGNNPRFATGNPLVELVYDSPVKTCPLGLKAPHCMLKERDHTVPLTRMEVEEGGESSYGFGTNFENFCDLIADCFDFLPRKQTMILAHSRAALPNSALRLPGTLQNMAMNECFHWAESPLPTTVVITVSNERKPSKTDLSGLANSVDASSSPLAVASHSILSLGTQTDNSVDGKLPQNVKDCLSVVGTQRALGLPLIRIPMFNLPQQCPTFACSPKFLQVPGSSKLSEPLAQLVPLSNEGTFGLEGEFSLSRIPSAIGKFFPRILGTLSSSVDPFEDADFVDIPIGAAVNYFHSGIFYLTGNCNARCVPPTARGSGLLVQPANLLHILFPIYGPLFSGFTLNSETETAPQSKYFLNPVAYPNS
ncbi:hypothetical protein B0H14DRAFT_2601342 [Mycena olivaceomarginata]|nr:hypothetical protein B0H14DRAFT_2601342 [Mycena olivaceomarginata]